MYSQWSKSTAFSIDTFHTVVPLISDKKTPNYIPLMSATKGALSPLPIFPQRSEIAMMLWRSPTIFLKMGYLCLPGLGGGDPEAYF